MAAFLLGTFFAAMAGAPAAPDAEPGQAGHDMPGMHAGHDMGGARQTAAAPHPAGSRQSGRAGDQGHARQGRES
jgi:hypothetical protein